MKKVELLSPVGNMECLYQAVMNGADAVYLGGKKFGARKFANNFDNIELIEAIKYCHLYGVKIYVTVNTMIYDNEFEEVINYVTFLHENNVDAVIVQDIGLISVLKKIFPNLEIHISTQSHNTNKYGVELLMSYGASRVVFARELSLSEIKNIDVDIEKEVFVHGALCVAYSGCCLFSSMNGGRSGNRGECVGSCRLPYKLYKNDKLIRTDGNYLLSTKSLCTIDKIGELIDSGITSFKIEGRMKSPEYVGYITRLYREKIDSYYKEKILNIEQTELDNIKKLYNREITHGYLFNEFGKTLMNIKTSNHIGIKLGKIINIDKKYIKIKLENDLNQEDGIRFDNDKGMIVNKLYNAKGLLVSSLKKGEIALVDNKISLTEGNTVRKTIDSLLNKSLSKLPNKKINVTISCKAHIGKLLEITINDSKNEITEYGNIVEESINSPTEESRIKAQLEKLGNTPFISVDTKIEMDKNIFISIKELNDLRRTIVEKLVTKREYDIPKPFIKKEISNIKKDIKKDEKLKINILVRNEEQLKCAIEENLNNIYVNDYNLYNKFSKIPNVYYRTNRVPNNFIELENKNILATELGAISKYSKSNNVVADYFLNVANINSVNALRNMGVSLVTISVESNIENIKSIAKTNNNIEIVVYGRLELMVSKYCPLNMLINNDEKRCSLCTTKDKYYLKDQYDNMYPIVNEKHLTHILHYKNLNIINDISEYKELGINNYRIELYDEDKKQIKEIINEIRNKYE